MADVDEARRLLERIDERTLALKEGVERINEDIDELKSFKAKLNTLTSDNYAGLRRIVDDQVRIGFETRSMTARDWMNVVIGALALVVAGLAYLQGR